MKTVHRHPKMAAKRNQAKSQTKSQKEIPHTDSKIAAEFVPKPKKKNFAGTSSKISNGSIEEIFSSNKLFECPQCDLQFINKNHLSRHINTGCVYKEGIKDWQVIDTEIQEVPISESMKLHKSLTERKVTHLPKVQTQEIRKPKKMPKLRKLPPMRKLTDDEKIPKIEYKCQICPFTSYDLNEFTKHKKLPHQVYALGPNGIQYAGQTVCHQGSLKDQS